MLQEINTKSNMVNVSKIEREMKKMQREAQIITVDTKEQNVTLLDYLLGGLVYIIFSKYRLILQQKKTVKNRFENQSVITLEHNSTQLE